VLEVELGRYIFDDGDEPSQTWAAEWGLQDHDVGIENTSENLADLIDTILHDAQQRWGDTHDIHHIEWQLVGDDLPGDRVADAVTAARVTLPDHLPNAG
jgi:hypothetical protein